jgi:hypothetical protein
MATTALRWAIRMGTTVGAVVVGAVILAANAQGQESVQASPPRVRAGDVKAAALLRDGQARSATFRALIETIEQSDLIVYVQTRPLRLPGQLQLVGATPGCRHVRVMIRTPGLDTDMIGWLGHELWHAVELARAPGVRNQESLLRYYQRIGSGGRHTSTAETGDAQAVGTKVLSEVRASGNR